MLDLIFISQIEESDSIGRRPKSMEQTIVDVALSQGIWAVVAIFLLLYIVKSNEKRDANYQLLLTDLMDKFSILHEIKTDVENIQDILDKNLESPEKKT